MKSFLWLVLLVGLLLMCFAQVSDHPGKVSDLGFGIMLIGVLNALVGGVLGHVLSGLPNMVAVFIGAFIIVIMTVSISLESLKIYEVLIGWNWQTAIAFGWQTLCLVIIGVEYFLRAYEKNCLSSD